MTKSFGIMKCEDFLYPQYDDKWNEAFESWKTILKKEAHKLLSENSDSHPGVLRRWKKIVEGKLRIRLVIEEVEKV